MVTAAKNPDNSMVVIVFNEGATQKNIELELDGKSVEISVSAQAIQSIVITN